MDYNIVSVANENSRLNSPSVRRRSGNDQGQLKYEGLIEVDKILPKVQDVLQDNSKRGTAAPGVEICICCCEFSIRIPRTTKERRKERDKRACDRSAFVTIFSCFTHPWSRPSGHWHPESDRRVVHTPTHALPPPNDYLHPTSGRWTFSSIQHRDPAIISTRTQ